MKTKRELTEHSNPRKTFGVSPKKVRNDANTREAQEDIEDFLTGRNKRDEMLDMRPSQPFSDFP
jgi:hypothetical protein